MILSTGKILMAGGRLYSSIVTQQQSNINFSFQGGINPAGWNNQVPGQGVQVLKNPAGITLPWNFTIVSECAGIDQFTATTPVTDFPDDVVRSEWYTDLGLSFSFKFSGLIIGKTYTIKTVSYDPGSVGQTAITVQSSTQTCLPSGAAAVLTFNSISPNGSSEILVTIAGTGQNPVINGLILIQN